MAGSAPLFMQVRPFCDADCSGEIDLAFLLHSAGSIHAERWSYMTQFVADFISQLDFHLDRTRVAVVIWSAAAYVGFPLDVYISRQDVIEVTSPKRFLLYQNAIFTADILSFARFFHTLLERAK